MRTQALPGENVLHRPTVTVTVIFAGYAGTFLAYTTPIEIGEGPGAGP